MDAFQPLLGVAFVFAMLGAAFWALRRTATQLRGGVFRGGLWKNPATQRTKTISRLDRQVLTQQHVLHLVRAGDRDLLLVTHSHGCTLLSEQPADRSQPAGASA